VRVKGDHEKTRYAEAYRVSPGVGQLWRFAIVRISSRIVADVHVAKARSMARARRTAARRVRNFWARVLTSMPASG
jgi:hypothetical protein